jgi:hypothetical protein
MTPAAQPGIRTAGPARCASRPAARARHQQTPARTDCPGQPAEQSAGYRQVHIAATIVMSPMPCGTHRSRPARWPRRGQANAAGGRHDGVGQPHGAPFWPVDDGRRSRCPPDAWKPHRRQRRPAPPASKSRRRMGTLDADCCPSRRHEQPHQAAGGAQMWVIGAAPPTLTAQGSGAPSRRSAYVAQLRLPHAV